jgi:bifunctional DNase/RNase
MEEHEMVIERVIMSLDNPQHAIILRQKDGSLHLPIWVGQLEANSISYFLREIDISRPMSHDLMYNVVRALGGMIERVVVHTLDNDTFYAHIEIKAQGRLTQIDARPSDAIALSLRAKVPIYASEEVVTKAGLEHPDKETAKSEKTRQDTSNPRQGSIRRPEPLGREERRLLSLFEKFVDSLENVDLEDKDQDKKGNNPDTPYSG